MSRVTLFLAGVVMLAFSSCTCCPPLPCTAPNSTAVVVNVSPSTGIGPIAGVSVMAGATAASCVPNGEVTTCSVTGETGRYDLQITAPGYKAESRSADVVPETDACACDKFKTIQLNVQLSPST